MKKKLPRKRKKYMIKKEGILAYISAQVVNEMVFERDGFCDYKFPVHGPIVKRKFTILGYY